MLNASSPNGTIYEEQENVDVYLDFECFVQYFIPVVFGLLVVFGFLGNTMVIYLILSKEKLKKTTNILILSLAVADLFFVLFCIPFTAVNYAMSYWPFGFFWCKGANFVAHVCAYASVWTLVLLSLDRYLAVVHPLLSKQIRTRRNTFLLVYLTWIVVFCGNIPVFLQYGIIEYEWQGFRRSACLNLAGLKNKIVLKVFYGCFFVFGYILPLTLISMLYGSLLKTLCRRSTMSGRQRRRSARAKRRVTRMIVNFVMAFAFCWLHIHVMFIVQNFTDIQLTIKFTAVMIAANCLAYVNSCINPILYVFISENFQRNFRSLLHVPCLPKSTTRSENYMKTDYSRRGTEETLVLNGTKEANSKRRESNNPRESNIRTQTPNKMVVK